MDVFLLSDSGLETGWSKLLYHRSKDSSVQKSRSIIGVNILLKVRRSIFTDASWFEIGNMEIWFIFFKLGHLLCVLQSYKNGMKLSNTAVNVLFS